MPDSRGEWLALAGVVVVAICARLYRLGLDSFWLDETASWWFASRPLAEQWQQIPFYEPHPPLYYGLLWLWSRVFGESEAGLRGLSAFASVLTIPFVYGLGRLAARGPEGKWVGLLAAMLVALYPTQIFYAQEARAYALLILAVSALMLALLWFIAHPETLARPLRVVLRDRTSGVRPAALVTLLGTAATFWFHNTALILVSPLLLIAAVLMLARTGFSWPLIRNFLVIGLGILVLWLPNIRWLISGMAEVTTGFWLKRPLWWDIIYVGDLLLGSATITDDVAWKIGITVCTLTSCALGAAALWKRGQSAAAIFLLFALVVPFLMTVAVSYVITPIFMPRVMLWIEIPAAILVAASLLWLPTSFLRRSVAVIVAGLLAAVVISGWGRGAKEPWRDVARILIDEAGPDDLILVDTAYAQVPMLYYRIPERSRGRWLPLPDAYPLPIGKNGYPDGFFLRDKVDAATLDRVRRAAESSRKVWHVTRGRTVYDWDQQLARTVRATHGSGKVRATSGDAALLTEYSRASTNGPRLPIE